MPFRLTVTTSNGESTTQLSEVGLRAPVGCGPPELAGLPPTIKDDRPTPAPSPSSALPEGVSTVS